MVRWHYPVCTYICVCGGGACSLLPPQWVLPFFSLLWANLVRVFQVGANLIPFSFPAGLALCFSEDLSNTLNWWTRRKTSAWTRNKPLLFPIFESIVLKLKIFKCTLFFFFYCCLCNIAITNNILITISIRTELPSASSYMKTFLPFVQTDIQKVAEMQIQKPWCEISFSCDLPLKA